MFTFGVVVYFAAISQCIFTGLHVNAGQYGWAAFCALSVLPISSLAHAMMTSGGRK
jgi:hypothetical protein